MCYYSTKHLPFPNNEEIPLSILVTYFIFNVRMISNNNNTVSHYVRKSTLKNVTEISNHISYDHKQITIYVAILDILIKT